MYYEESLINGVLHWRSTPKGDWVEKTKQQLTEMLLEARLERSSPLGCRARL